MGPEDSALPGPTQEKGQLGKQKTDRLADIWLLPFTFLQPWLHAPPLSFPSRVLSPNVETHNVQQFHFPTAGSLPPGPTRARPCNPEALLPSPLPRSVSESGLCCPKGPTTLTPAAQDLKTILFTRPSSPQPQRAQEEPQNLKSTTEKK